MAFKDLRFTNSFIEIFNTFINTIIFVRLYHQLRLYFQLYFTFNFTSIKFNISTNTYNDKIYSDTISFKNVLNDGRRIV